MNNKTRKKVACPLFLILAILIVGCASGKIRRNNIVPKTVAKCGCGISGQGLILSIKWQRLISEGKTCPRCGSTEQELEKAVTVLGQALETMGIRVVLEKDSLSKAEFEKDPLRSNRIWINGRPLEDYVAGKVGQSPCCDECGPVDCRTLEVEGQAYETIPSVLIVQAGLIAASQMLVPETKEPCCGDKK